MRGRRTVALIAAIACLLVAALVIALTGVGSDRKAAVTREQAGLSFNDEERIFHGRIELSNYCFSAIQASRGTAPSSQVTEAGALATVDHILRQAQEHPWAHVSEVGSMRTVLESTARDLEHPACLPEEASRLRAAAARLPQ
jgi:hypothetical protein